MTQVRQIFLGEIRAAAFALTIASMGLLIVAFGPTVMGYQAAIVTSGSMGGSMPVGSVAQTRIVPATAVRVGDIVSFRHGGRDTTVTHRVVGIKPVDTGVGLVTQGDANGTPDPEAVVVRGSIARVDRVIPYAGFIAAFARSRTGWMLLFILPLVGLMTERRSWPRWHRVRLSWSRQPAA